MNIIGVDCATKDKYVGVALGRLTPTRLKIVCVFVGDRPGTLLEYLVKSYAPSEPTLLALDAPLGDRFHGTYPPNYNEGHHLSTGKGTTLFQVVPKDF
jgi:predicted RNase H-like nuclease